MLESLLVSNFVINETSCVFLSIYIIKFNFPVGHYISALRMVNKHYVQRHVSYYSCSLFLYFEIYFRNIVADTSYLL